MLKAYLWFYINIPLILKKRKQLKAIKKVNEKEIIKYVTSKIINDNSFFSTIVNKISYIYSRMLGIKPIEYYQKNI